jgi:hypothetical protein
MGAPVASLSVLARRMNFVRETSPNDGVWVTLFQRHTGNKPGDSWCQSFVCWLLDIAYKGKSPLVKTAACRIALAEAARKGWIVTEPQRDDLFFYVHKDGIAHHVGIVTEVKADGTVVGIAGNTSEDGASSNGTGVYEHAIKPAVYVRIAA